MRFDLFAARRLNISRNKAAELIKSGKILLNGQICSKPSFEVGEFDKLDGTDGLNLDAATGVNLKADENSAESENQNLREANLTDATQTARDKAPSGEQNLNSSVAKIELVGEIYVGRGALKLKSFLAACPLEIKGKNALDVGSSTGGFVQILLQNGVKSVTALDVGSSQLDKSLRADSRVIVAENTDVREFAAGFQNSGGDGKFDGSEQNLKTQIKPSKDSRICDKFGLGRSNFAERCGFLSKPSKSDFTPLNLTEASKNEQAVKCVYSQNKTSNLNKKNAQTGCADEPILAQASTRSVRLDEANFAIKTAQSDAAVASYVSEANLARANSRPNAEKIAESNPRAAKNVAKKFDLITCDVSFISLKEILPSIDALAGENCDIILLFKPQFEVGRTVKRNKKGVVTDAKAVREARAKFELAAANLGWIMRQTRECEVKGKEGNAEFFYAFNKR